MKPQMKAVAALTLGLSAASLLSVLGGSSTLLASPRDGKRPGGSGGSTTSATPRPPRTPRPTPTPRPKPVAGGRDIVLLQGALERTLTATEKAAITSAATTRDAAIRAAVTAFEAEVAALFDMSSSELQGKINNCNKENKGRPHRDLRALLEDALNRALTDDEAEALTSAITKRDMAIAAAVETYRTTIAAAVGLSIEDLDAKVQAFLDAQHDGEHSGGHGGPPAGKPDRARPTGGQLEEGQQTSSA